jgi:transcriptional regulator with PAS, ATPase and Fis domain
MSSKKQFAIPGGEALKSLFTLLFDSMFWVDEMGNVLQADQQSQLLLGVPADSGSLKHLFEITPLLTLIEWKKYWKELKKGKALSIRTEVMASGHTLLPSTLHLSFCPGEEQAAFIGIAPASSEPREKALQKLLKYQFAAGWWEWNTLTQRFKCSNYTADIFQLDKADRDTTLDQISKTLEGKLGAEQYSLLKQSAEAALKKMGGFSLNVKIDEQAYIIKSEVLTTSLRPFLMVGSIQQEQQSNAVVETPAKTEDSFSELLDQLNKVMDALPTSVFIIDKHKKIVSANAHARKQLGLKAYDIQGLPLLDLFTSDPLKQASYNQKLEVRSADGHHITLNASVKKLQLGEEALYIISSNPEIAAVQKENDLKAAQEKIKKLSDRLKEENLFLKQEISANYNFNNIITRSANYRKVLSQVARVADTDATVLIMGETGTGKELLARAIHSFSEREEGPMIKVNCAALPENLIESELFGHEKGAFTGANQQRKGRFELAHKGSIFLDEIGEMPLNLQSKLLRVLQEGEFERVGGAQTIKIDTRVIAATNRDLKSMVDKGTFREDLYYRLNVFPIQNLALRERPDDIPVLVEHFTRKFNKKFGKNVEKANKADLDRLRQYSFPGNIRELENIVERAIILSSGKKLNLKASFRPPKDNLPASSATENSKGMRSFEEMQRQYIVEALEKTKWRITGPQGAARLLDLKDRTLMSKMRKLGIKREDYV